MVATLAVDVGATNLRLAVVADRSLIAVEVLPTASVDDLAATVDDYLRRVGGTDAVAGQRIAGAGIALAGPVEGGHGVLTNGTLRVDANALTRALGIDVVLVNDLQAHAHGLDLLAAEALVPLGSAARAPAIPRGLRLVLAPGTGFAIAANVDGSRVLASEVGHADAAPGNALERELIGVLGTRFQRVTWEHVLSAPGLANLHWALGCMWGAHVDVQPAEVTRRALVDEEPLACHAVETYVGWLGAFAGGAALTWLARGGVYLAGNLVNVIGDVLAGSGFRRRFDDHAPLADLARATPTYRIIEPGLALLGAAHAQRVLTI